jgi:S-phase kinase-associated protein 1
MSTTTQDKGASTSASASASPASAAETSAASSGKDDKETKKDVKDVVKGLDDDKDATKPLKLTSKDKKEFIVERKMAFVSVLVKTSMEDDNKANEVPLPAVSGSILELIVTYMKEHKGVEPPIIEKPLRSKSMKDVCPYKWDAEYIDKIGNTRQQLYDLILAANYMDIKSLLHLGCAKVASLIKGEPLEKIKEILDPIHSTQKVDNKDAKDGKHAKKDEKDNKSASSGSASASASSSSSADALLATASASAPAASVKK